MRALVTVWVLPSTRIFHENSILTMFAQLETLDGCGQFIEITEKQPVITRVFYVPITGEGPFGMGSTLRTTVRRYEIAGRIDAETWLYREIWEG